MKFIYIVYIFACIISNEPFREFLYLYSPEIRWFVSPRGPGEIEDIGNWGYLIFQILYFVLIQKSLRISADLLD